MTIKLPKEKEYLIPYFKMMETNDTRRSGLKNGCKEVLDLVIEKCTSSNLWDDIGYESEYYNNNWGGFVWGKKLSGQCKDAVYRISNVNIELERDIMRLEVPERLYDAACNLKDNVICLCQCSDEVQEVVKLAAQQNILARWKDASSKEFLALSCGGNKHCAYCLPDDMEIVVKDETVTMTVGEIAEKLKIPVENFRIKGISDEV